MAFATVNMNLAAWDLTTDPYSHTDLTNNWQAIDIHDHSPGKGVKIGTAGISNNAITQALLANASVGTAQLIDGSITAQKLAAGAGTPLGVIAFWYRQASEPVPSLFAVCDGTPWASITNDLGYSTGNIPNLINAFAMGVLLANIGTTGGANSINLAHTHTVNAHSHNVNAHAHTISADGGHSHTIAADGSHVHGWIGNVLQQRTTGVGSASGTRQTLFVPGLNAGGTIDNQVDAPMDAQGTHSHSGATGAVAAHSHGGATATSTATTDTQSPSTSSSLSASQDNRPAWVGLLPIMRVKNF